MRGAPRNSESAGPNKTLLSLEYESAVRFPSSQLGLVLSGSHSAGDPSGSGYLTPHFPSSLHLFTPVYSRGFQIRINSLGKV